MGDLFPLMFARSHYIIIMKILGGIIGVPISFDVLQN